MNFLAVAGGGGSYIVLYGPVILGMIYACKGMAACSNDTEEKLIPVDV